SQRPGIIELQIRLPIDAPTNDRASPLNGPVISLARNHAAAGFHPNLGVRVEQSRLHPIDGALAPTTADVRGPRLETAQLRRVVVQAGQNRKAVVPAPLNQVVAGKLVVESISEDDRPKVALRRGRADVEIDPHVLRQFCLEPERVVAHSRREQLATLDAPKSAGGEKVL